MPGAAQRVRCNRSPVEAADTVRHSCWAAVYGDALPVAYFLVMLDTADLAFGGVAGQDGLILWP